ncbi:DUF6622 family protein [Pseudoduganella plicata]|uniref:Transmembrane protein n=1 Tax=Pseudoduganella plicata TaxID=321984 RepID=A0A4P7BMC9_9BURK|nr:DUF6622 family protein [Pseudoduganella plicata]QBQ38895.1 hypothetical protein E1742_24085 [Pseudoduganella plicata]GGZ09434.1 hypothetical protein GCM10007388_48650 [Pseudoduganella plicata]
MLQQIISHTPLYVWAILAFLVHRGVAASRERTMTLRAVAIVPLVMTALALQEIDRRFGLAGVPFAAWGAGAAAGAMVAWHVAAGSVTGLDHTAGTVTQRGSWLPLAMMLAVFSTRYALAAASAMQPALQHSATFAMSASLLLGLFNGLLAGRPLRCVRAFTLAAR